MRVSFLCRSIAALGILALAACAGQTTVPAQSASQPVAPQTALAALLSSSNAAIGSDAGPQAASPCNIPKIWYFRGGCKAVAMKKAGVTVVLPAYKGMTLTMAFGQNTAGAKAPFVFGDGTSATDITGTLNGAPFAVYGKLPCVNLKGKQVKCTGTAFLYTEWVNVGKADVTFGTSPTATVTTTGKFPGTKSCSVINLQFSNGVPAYWLLLPIKGTPSNGKVSFASVPFQIDVYGAHFWAFGFTCQ